MKLKLATETLFMIKVKSKQKDKSDEKALINLTTNVIINVPYAAMN